MTEATSPKDIPVPTDHNEDESVILIPYPKIVFLWPSWVMSIIAASYMWFSGDNVETTAAVVLGWTFLIVLGLNFVVLSFDFPRATSLLLFATVVALLLGGTLIVVWLPDLLPAVSGWITSFHPRANSTFYFLFSAIMTTIYIIVAIVVRLDYWEVRPNELLHHHGVLSDLERFSAPNLKIDKEINDVFEYLLMGAGRLVLHPSHQPRAIVLDNIFFITKKERAITKMLSALQVQVREEKA